MRVVFLVVILIGLSGCSIGIFETIRHCPDGAIEWVDVLKINGITYRSTPEVSAGAIETEKLIGEVRYTLNEQACSDHPLQNGDAAYLEEGTKIYKLHGYESSYRVSAGDLVYTVEENPSAETLGDMYDIRNRVEHIRVKNISVDHDFVSFSDQEINDFIKEWLELSIKDEKETLEKVEPYDPDRLIVEFELKDGTFMKSLYWPEENIFDHGASGTERIQEMIQKETEALRSE